MGCERREGDVEQPKRHFLNFMGQFRRQPGTISDGEGDDARRENPCRQARIHVASSASHLLD